VLDFIVFAVNNPILVLFGWGLFLLLFPVLVASIANLVIDEWLPALSKWLWIELNRLLKHAVDKRRKKKKRQIVVCRKNR